MALQLGISHRHRNSPLADSSPLSCFLLHCAFGFCLNIYNRIRRLSQGGFPSILFFPRVWKRERKEKKKFNLVSPAISRASKDCLVTSSSAASLHNLLAVEGDLFKLWLSRFLCFPSDSVLFRGWFQGFFFYKAAFFNWNFVYFFCNFICVFLL